MRRLWGLLSLIPLVAFSQSDLDDESFNIEDQAEEALLQLNLEDEIDLNISQSIKYYNQDQKDSLFFEEDAEIEECLETALPWVPEKIKRDEVADYLDSKVNSATKKNDEDFSYDLSFEHNEIVYEPILETVPKRTGKLFNRPKVIESKESKVQETSETSKRKSSAITRKPSSLEVKQKKLKELREKRKILTNRVATQKRQKNKVVLKTEPEALD